MDDYVAVVKLNHHCETSVSFASEGKPKSKLNNEDARKALSKVFPGMNVKIVKVIRMPETGPDTRIDIEVERD